MFTHRRDRDDINNKQETEAAQRTTKETKNQNIISMAKKGGRGRVNSPSTVWKTGEAKEGWKRAVSLSKRGPVMDPRGQL